MHYLGTRVCSSWFTDKTACGVLCDPADFDEDEPGL